MPLAAPKSGSALVVEQWDVPLEPRAENGMVAGPETTGSAEKTKGRPATRRVAPGTHGCERGTTVCEKAQKEAKEPRDSHEDQSGSPKEGCPVDGSQVDQPRSKTINSSS